MFENVKRWLRSPEEINGANRCPTYLYRWHLFSCRWFKVYLHRFVADDWSLDLHDHPKRFVSVGLCGAYHETSKQRRGKIRERTFRAPWFRTFPAEHTHRIRIVGKECWTLVIVFAASRKWGFVHDGKWIGWREYVGGVGGIADEMKACQ